MCGICGIYGINGLSKEDLIDFQHILIKCESRGTDAFGYYVSPKGDTFKTKGSVSKYVAKHPKMYNSWKNSNIILAHTRAVTKGSEDKNQNNHPFETKDFVLAHNGQIWNHEKFGYKSDIETDSYVIIQSIQDEFDKTKDIPLSIKTTCEKLEGSYACWIIHKETNTIYLFRHNNPIDIRYNSERKIIVFASEEKILSGMYKPSLISGFFSQLSYGEIKEHKIYKIEKDGGLLECGEFLANSVYTYNTNYPLGTNGSLIKYNKSHKSALSSDMKNSDIEETLFNETGLTFGVVQSELDYLGVQLYIRNGKFNLYFSSNETYEKYEDELKLSGYTISPVTKTLTIQSVEDLDEVVCMINGDSGIDTIKEYAKIEYLEGEMQWKDF